MDNLANTYFLTLPLYVEPTRYFRDFIEGLGSPLQHVCGVQYWRGKLRFSSGTLPNANGNIGSGASLDPEGINIRSISVFASKFNAAMSIPECKFYLDIDDSSIDGSVAVLRVRIVVNSLAAKMTLNNFFTLFENNY